MPCGLDPVHSFLHSRTTHRCRGMQRHPNGEAHGPHDQGGFSKGAFVPLETALTDLVREGEEVVLMIATLPMAEDPFWEAAGGWKGRIGGEAFERTLPAVRLIATRPARSG